MFINTYPRFPPFLLYFRCKLGVTFAQSCFRDGVKIAENLVEYAKNDVSYP